MTIAKQMCKANGYDGFIITRMNQRLIVFLKGNKVVEKW